MIVDDDSDLLVLFRLIFEQEDFEVLTVDSGQDCLNELERGFEGIILMDIMMPFMDGFSTIKKIVNKGFSKNVIISVISANQHPDKTKMKDLAPYIRNYFNKPFNIDLIVQNITK